MQTAVAEQDCIDLCRCPERSAVRPESPTQTDVTASHDGSLKIDQRLSDCDVVRDIELRHVAIDGPAHTAVIFVRTSVPEDDDPILVQHCERAALRGHTHCGLYAHTAPVQYTPSPGTGLQAALLGLFSYL